MPEEEHFMSCSQVIKTMILCWGISISFSSPFTTGRVNLVSFYFNIFFNTYASANFCKDTLSDMAINSFSFL